MVSMSIDSDDQIHMAADEAITSMSSSILITGSARSGTTMMGQLIGSCENIEYEFEPAALQDIISQSENMPHAVWKHIVASYMFNHVFLGLVSGRTINQNNNDDSSIFKIKPIEEINRKLNTSWRFKSLKEFSQTCRLCFKMPDIVPFLEKFEAAFPGLTMVVMKRNPVDSIASLLEKKWFDDEQAETNPIWPYRVYRAKKVPYWVPLDECNDWIKRTPLEKSAIYYIKSCQVYTQRSTIHIVDYDKIVAEPKRQIDAFLSRLDLKMTKQTQDLIKGISIRRKSDFRIFQMLPDDLRNEIERAYTKLK